MIGAGEHARAALSNHGKAPLFLVSKKIVTISRIAHGETGDVGIGNIFSVCHH